MPQIAKPILEIRPEDLQAVCDAAWFEDEQLDFKITVPNREQPGNDPWRANRTVANHGRDQLLAAVVAFANSYGGDLLIGIAETDGNPGSAREIAPIPACMDLAARLSQQANECVEPHLSTLEVRGIPTHEDGSGVVILRVGQSRSAPHRLKTTKECYHRVRHETLTMSMRQIQDLTFEVARGAERIDRRFAALATDFSRWLVSRPSLADHLRYSIRLSFVPLAEMYLPNVHAARLVCTQREFITTRNGQQSQEHNLANSADFRPILRGTRAMSPGEPKYSRASLYCDGAYSVEVDFSAEREAPEQQLNRRSFVFFEGWMLGTMCGALKTIEAFRVAAGNPQAEYAAELVVSSSPELPIIFNQHYGPTGSLSGETYFPRYVIGPTDSWSDFLTLFLRDFHDAIGMTGYGELRIDLVR